MARHDEPVRGACFLKTHAIPLVGGGQGVPSPPAELRSELMARLGAEGFDAAGIAPATVSADQGIRLAAFLNAGWHGRMDWLARRAQWRASPRALWPAAKSAIIAAMSYAPRRDPLEGLTERSKGLISAYAQSGDYHEVLKARLKRVAGWLAERARVEVKVFVDTAPLMEKPLAAAAGLGWQGKHTNLVSRSHGSWLFLGVILTDLDLPADPPHEDHCGSCTACLDICPTRAFAAPYQLDARRCISYLTIEHNGHIPLEFRTAIGNRIYGCDDCLAVCPWNKFAAVSRHSQFHPRTELEAPLLSTLAALDDPAFRTLFAGSAIKRIGRDRFVRNVMIACGNSGDPSLVDCVTERIQDPSALVRAVAVWALSKLIPAHAFAALAARIGAAEPDPFVRDEWRQGRDNSV